MSAARVGEQSAVELNMVYLNPDALHSLKRDVADFMNRAVAQAESNTPPVRPTMAPAKSGN